MTNININSVYSEYAEDSFWIKKLFKFVTHYKWFLNILFFCAYVACNGANKNCLWYVAGNTRASYYRWKCCTANCKLVCAKNGIIVVIRIAYKLILTKSLQHVALLVHYTLWIYLYAKCLVYLRRQFWEM